MTMQEADRIVKNYIYEHETELGHGRIYVALSMASRALQDWDEMHRKETPTKVIMSAPMQPNVVTPACPHCGTFLRKSERYYRCPICGQMLDWRID